VWLENRAGIVLFKRLDGKIKMAVCPIKAWDVQVSGYGTQRYFSQSRGKALAEAWRCDVFQHLPFKDFLKISGCRRSDDVPDGFGDPITADGKPAFFIEQNRAYVRAVLLGQTVIGNWHPSEIEPESYRPSAYRTPTGVVRAEGMENG